jgi:hypothetical protein
MSKQVRHRLNRAGGRLRIEGVQKSEQCIHQRTKVPTDIKLSSHFLRQYSDKKQGILMGGPPSVGCQVGGQEEDDAREVVEHFGQATGEGGEVFPEALEGTGGVELEVGLDVVLEEAAGFGDDVEGDALDGALGFFLAVFLVLVVEDEVQVFGLCVCVCWWTGEGGGAGMSDGRV